ncbi:MAG: SPOR domain-containing protein [Acidiferrobacterales bacterium]|nr:SPOR domain-containing protein [Acidiferrobacterales bacterium]
MAKRRKKTTRRRHKLKIPPHWIQLGLGLAVGIVLTMLVQLVVQRVSTPGSGLRTLFGSSSSGKQALATKAPATKTPANTPQPRYDFYTILPEIETVLPEGEPVAASRRAGPARSEGVSYVLQAGSFARFDDADRLRAQLTLNGLTAHIQKVTIEGKGEYHRVRLGPYSDIADLDDADRRLRALGIQGLRLRVKREG